MAKATEQQQLTLDALYGFATGNGLLITKTNAKGRDYFTTGQINYSPKEVRWQGEDGKEYTGNVSGMVCVNVSNVREASAVAERRAATVQSEFSKLTAEQRKAFLEAEMAKL